MRAISITFLLASAALLGACSSDSDAVFTANNGPLAFTRFVNAISDSGAGDWRFVDVVENSPTIFGLPCRSTFPGAGDQGTGAGSRHLRVFQTSTDIVQTQKIFFDTMRPAGKNDPYGVEEARRRLEGAFEIADKWLAGKTWAIGNEFTLADCAAAPAFGYARMVQPSIEKWKNVVAYANRLNERPSYQRVMKDAAPMLAQMGFGKKQ